MSGPRSIVHRAATPEEVRAAIDAVFAGDLRTRPRPQRDGVVVTSDIDILLADWAESERTGNTDALDTMLTDDFMGIGPVGFVLDKDAWLSRFDQGLRYERLTLDDVSSRRHGDAAIVVARQHAAGTARGNPMQADVRVSFTLVARDDVGWRIAGMQYSFIGAPPPLVVPRP